MTMKLLPVFAVVLALAGCSGLGNVRDDFDLNKAGAAGQGLVIGTFTTDSPYPYFTVYTTMRIIATPNPRTLDLTEIVAESGCNLKSSGESPFKDYCGRLVALKLPAGDYQIFWFKSDMGSVIMGPREFKPVSFTVKAGRATYIGNIHMTLDTTDETFFGKPIVPGGWPEVKDARERDIPLLQQAVPAITADLIDYQILQFPPRGDVGSQALPIPVIVR